MTTFNRLNRSQLQKFSKHSKTILKIFGDKFAKLQQSETIKIPFNGEFIRSTFRYFYRSSYHSRNNITNPFVTGQCRRIFLYLHKDVIFPDLNWLQLYSSHSLDRSVGLITNRSIDGQILHMHQRIIKFTEECAVDE